MKITFVIGLVTVSLFEGTLQQCFSTDDQGLVQKSSKVNLYSGQQGFSLALLHAINKLMPNENLFFSPYSTYHALLIAYFLAGNATESYLKKTLRLNLDESKKDILQAYKLDKFMTQFRAVNASYEFKNANKVYVSTQVPVRDCIQTAFTEELNETDFRNNPEGARNDINAWVEGITNHMIKDLLPPGTIDQTTDLVLVNAAYFKGFWENKFDPDQTKQEVFYVHSNKQIMVEMMHVEGTFNHDVSESLGAHILELPYQGNDISMFILLPPFTNDSVETTLKSLTLERFNDIVKGSLIPRTVHVGLPKFSLETTVELVPVLESMGLGNLFGQSGDFSTLTEKNVTLGSGLHKARIEVDEDGTKAAAATVLFSFRSSRPLEPAQFICNHPFVYIIYDKFERAILFSGVFRRPY